METKRLVMAVALLVAMTTTADAQGWLGKLKEKAVEKVKEKVENKTEAGRAKNRRVEFIKK